MISRRIENKKALSGKGFVLDYKLFDKLFMCTKNNKDPKIDPCSIPTFINYSLLAILQKVHYKT